MPATYRKEGNVYRTKTGKPMRKPGRRCRRSEVEADVLTQLRLGADYSEAARCCGVSRPTLHRWMQQDLYLRDRMMLAKEVGKRFGRRPGNY